MPDSLPFSDRALQPGEADLLGRGGFVRNLATILCNAPSGDSVVFALYGKWGEGKTSTLTLLDQELAARAENAERVPEVIRFNPWVFSGREHLFNAFFEDIGNAIGSSEIPNPEKTAEKWKRLGAYSDLAGSAIGGIDAALNLVGLAIPGGRLASAGLRTIGEAAKSAAQADGNQPTPSLADLRKELEQTLEALPRPLLVVLDDLDRLPPYELVEIFQLLKATADLPNVHYLLLCDRGNIERSLKKQKLHPDYLEKIVQFSAPLPAVSTHKLRSLLIAQIRGLFGEFAAEDYRLDEPFWECLADGPFPRLFTTLRDVKRYLGELRLALPVFCSDGHFELNPDHFLKLQALRLFAPEIVEEILSHREIFVPKQLGLFVYDEELQQNESARKAFATVELPKKVKKGKRVAVEPLIQGLLLGGGIDWSKDEAAAEARFLTSALWFDCYFTLEIPTVAVRMSDAAAIEACLAERPDEIGEVIARIASEAGYAALVRSLTTRLKSLTKEHGQRILHAVLSTAAHAGIPDANFPEPGIHDYFAHWVHQLPIQARADKIVELIESSRNHEFFADILYIAENSEVSRGGLFQNLEAGYQKIGKATARLIEAKAAAGEPILYEGFWQAHDVWAKWGSRGKLRDWVRDQTKTDEGLTIYLKALGRFDTAHTDDHVEEEYFCINHRRLETFPSLEDGERRCRTLTSNTTDERLKMLYVESERALRAQAEYRRGKRVMPRKFPELGRIRFADPQFVNGLGEQCAIVFDRAEIAGNTSVQGNPLLERFNALFAPRSQPLATQLNLTADGGQTSNPAVLFSSKPEHAVDVGRKLGQDYLLMLFNQGQLLAIGLNGEGRLPLGTLKDLVLKPDNQP